MMLIKEKKMNVYLKTVLIFVGLKLETQKGHFIVSLFIKMNHTDYNINNIISSSDFGDKNISSLFTPLVLHLVLSMTLYTVSLAGVFFGECTPSTLLFNRETTSSHLQNINIPN